MRTHAATDIGRKSQINEDTILETTLEALDGPLLSVADGMGGHQAGDIASRMAITELQEVVTRECTNGQTDPETLLATAIEKANEEIRLLAADASAYEGIGTTLVAAIVADGDVIIAHVGDSRAYLVDDRRIKQLTGDQTLVTELIEEGVVDKENADEHPQRHILTQALGTNETIEPECCSNRLNDPIEPSFHT